MVLGNKLIEGPRSLVRVYIPSDSFVDKGDTRGERLTRNGSGGGCGLFYHVALMKGIHALFA
jgi:hypothetical protein